MSDRTLFFLENGRAVARGLTQSADGQWVSTQDADTIYSYTLDWAGWLAGDTIADASTSGKGVTIQAFAFDDTSVTFQALAPSADGVLRVQIVASSGRIDGRVLKFAGGASSARSTVTVLATPVIPGTEWASGVSYEPSDVVWVDGTAAYRARTAHTAGASFSADLEAGKWTLAVDVTPVTQQIDAVKLDKTGEASSTTTKPRFLGAAARTMEDWFSDVVTPRAFGGVLDGTTDDTQALVSAVAAAGTDKAIVVDGPLFLASPQSVSIPAGASLEFRGTGRLIWNFGALQSVTVEDPGRGYSSIPTVTVSGGGALGTVTMETDTVEQLMPIWSADSASVVAGGSGYAVGDLIRPAGGSYNNMGPAVFAVSSVSGGAVTGLTVAGTGGGYLQSPSGTLTTAALSGSGAGCTLTMAVTNRTVALASGGTGYTVGDALTVAGNGIPATLTVTAVSSGAVTGLTVASQGAYAEPPGWDTTYSNTDFHLFRGLTGGTGSGCQVYTTTTAMDAGVANAGTGYSVGDPLTVVGGAGTAATYRVDTVSSTGAIVTLHATSRGAYTALPSSPATVTGGTGTGASLHLLWRIKSVAVTAAGAYTTTPTITVSGGGTPRWPARLTPVGRKPTLACTIQAAIREIFSGYRRFDGGLTPSRADVRWFGAAGDLATDDTDAIQAAIDSVIHVDFPPGGYACAGMLFVRPFRKLRGSGRTPADGGYAQFGTNLLFTGSARAGIDSDLGRDLPCFEMSDMTLSCSGTSARTHTLRLNNPRNCVLRNIEVGSSPTGNAGVLHSTALSQFSFDTSSYPCWINHVVDCLFGSVAGWSFVDDGITDSRFIGNYFSGGKGVVEYGANNQWGLGMTDNASKSMFYLPQRSLVQYAKYTTLTGTSFQQQAGAANTAITVQGMDYNRPIDAYVSVTGNTFNNCPAAAHIFFANARRMAFNGNNFDTSAAHFSASGDYDYYAVVGNVLPRSFPGATSGAVVASNVR